MSLYDLSFSFLKSDFTICNSIKIDKIQKEFLNLLILSVNKDDSKTSYKFKLDKLANYLELSKEKCCKVVKSLLQIYIEMKSISDKSYLCFNILSSVFFNIDDNYIEVAFYENIKPFYLKLRKLFELGNATEETVNFNLDTKAPTFIVTGVEDGEIKNEQYDINVSLQLDEDTLDEVTLNGSPVEIKDNAAAITVTEKGDYKLTMKAHDDAGNEAEQTISFTYGEKSHVLLYVLIGVGVLVVLGGGSAIILAAKKKKNN